MNIREMLKPYVRTLADNRAFAEGGDVEGAREIAADLSEKVSKPTARVLEEAVVIIETAAAKRDHP